MLKRYKTTEIVWLNGSYTHTSECMDMDIMEVKSNSEVMGLR